MLTDPVCGLEIDHRQAFGPTEYEGETYYFCSQDCKQRFEAEPERYAGPETAEQMAG